MYLSYCPPRRAGPRMEGGTCRQGNEDLCIPFLFPRTDPDDSSSCVSNEVLGRGTESAPGFRRPLCDVCARGFPRTDGGRAPGPTVAEEDPFELVRDDVEVVLEETDEATELARPWGFAAPLAGREFVDAASPLFLGSAGCCDAVFVFVGSMSRQMRATGCAPTRSTYAIYRNSCWRRWRRSSPGEAAPNGRWWRTGSSRSTRSTAGFDFCVCFWVAPVSIGERAKLLRQHEAICIRCLRRFRPPSRGLVDK